MNRPVLLRTLLFAAAVWPAAVPAAALAVHPVTAPALKRIVAKDRGHVVLVNFWATWCIPCMKEFPGLVRLSRADQRQGLVVLAVSGDSPRDLSSRVKPFLVSRRASFPQYIVKGDLDTFINGFQPKWQGDFPQTFVFDKRGHLAAELGQQQSVKHLQAVVHPLLKKAGRR